MSSAHWGSTLTLAKDCRADSSGDNRAKSPLSYHEAFTVSLGKLLRLRGVGGQMGKTEEVFSDRITTRSPGNGGGGHRRYNARLGQSPIPDPGVTPVQRQGYPSARSGVGRPAAGRSVAAKIFDETLFGIDSFVVDS